MYLKEQGFSQHQSLVNNQPPQSQSSGVSYYSGGTEQKGKLKKKRYSVILDHLKQMHYNISLQLKHLVQKWITLIAQLVMESQRSGSVSHSIINFSRFACYCLRTCSVKKLQGSQFENFDSNQFKNTHFMYQHIYN